MKPHCFAIDLLFKTIFKNNQCPMEILILSSSVFFLEAAKEIQSFYVTVTNPPPPLPECSLFNLNAQSN